MTAIIRVLRRTIIGALLMGVFVVAGLQTLTAHAAPGINQQMNFQGRLLTSQGATVADGYYNMQFKIYQDGTGTVAGNPSGTLKWTESWLNSEGHGVQVKNGYMSLQLGSITSLSSVDWNQDTLWLSINVGNTNASCTPFTSCGSDGEMLPMKRLSSTPYAFNAGRLGGLSAAQFLQLAQGVQTEAGTNTASIAINKTGTGGSFLNLQANNIDVFTIANTGDITFGNNIDHAISVTTAAASTAGKSLTISAGTAGTGAGALTGGNLVLQGGNGGGTGGNGGSLVLDAGAAAAGGTGGSITIGGTNASSINLGQNTTITGGKSLTITGGATGTRPASPTEGMLYYDTDTKQLITYSNGKWQADRSTATKIVAASNSSQALKDAADYVATGTGDQTVINSALTAAAGGKVYLTEGTFTVNGSISIPNNTTLAGAGSGTVVTIPNSFNANLNAIVNTTTGGGGTGITVQDLRLEGNKAGQTSGNTYGIYLSGVSSSSSSSGTPGGKIANVWSSNWYGGSGIYLNNSHNTTLNGNTLEGNAGTGGGPGIGLSNSTGNTITGNVTRGNLYGIYMLGSANNTVNGNTITGNSVYGIYLDSNANNNTITGNKLYDSGGNTANNAVYLTGADSNTITGNNITDASATTTNYAINISNSTSDTNYLANNTFGTGSINDAGTGTVYANQSRGANGGQLTNRTANDGQAFTVQNASGANIFAVDTTNSQIVVGNSSTAGKLTISDGSSNTATIVVGALAGNYTYTIPTTTANDTFCLVTLNNCAADSTQFIQNQNTAAQTTARFWIDGTGRADTSILTPIVDTASSTTLNIGTTNASGVTIGKANTTTTVQGNLGVTLNTTAGTTITCRNTSGYLSVCDSSVLTPSAANFIQNGTSVQTGANFWIDGIGKVGGGLQSGSLDTLTVGNTLSIGIGNAGGVTIGKSTTTTTIQGNLGVTLNTTTGTTQVCRNTTGLLSSCDSSYLAPTTTNFIQNQDASAQAGSFNITGTGIAGTLQAANIVTASIDTSSSTALNIGTTNANTINLNQNVTVAAGKSLTLVGGTTASRPGSPAEGMLYYDTDTKQLLVYANGKWQADRSTASKIVGTSASGGTSGAVASLNADGADYVNTSATSAQTVINTALTAVGSTGGTVYLMEGTYVIDDSISIPNNVTLTGAGSGTVIKLKNGINANINAVVATDTTTGTGVSVTNLRIDGNKANNTSGTQNGIYFSSMGSGNGASALQGGKLHSLWISNLRSYGIMLENSNNGIISDNHINNNSFGLYLQNNNNMTVADNTIQGNTRGIYASPVNRSAITGNTLESNANGMLIGGTSFGNAFTGNVFNNSSTNGLNLANASDNTISGNRFRSNGGSTTNEAIALSTATNNTITSNTITDSSATTTNYAIDISDAASTGNYLADNTLGGGSINDATANGNIYGGQVNSANNFIVQPAGTIELQKSTNITGTLAASTSVLTPSLDRSSAGTLTIGTNATNTTAITIGSSGITTTIQGNTGITLNTTTGTTQVCRNATGVLSTCDATYLSPTASNFIQNGTSQQASANFNISGSGVATTLQASTSVLTPLVDAVSSATALNIGTTNANVINLNQNVVVAANKSLALAGGTTANRPASPTEGMIWYDTTTKQLLTYSNGKWQSDRSTSTKIVAASNASQALKDGADYVATGTGDQGIINTALTAAAGGKVYLTEGTYTVNGSINVPNNTTLSGSGNGTIITLPSALNTSINVITNTDTSTGTGMTIRDLKLDGKSSVNTAGTQTGLYLYNVGLSGTGATVTGLQVINFRSDAVYLLNVGGSAINGNTFNAAAATNGSAAIDAKWTQGTTFSNNTFISNYWGLRLDGSSSNTVNGNFFYNNNEGLNTNSANNNAITGNTFNGNATDVDIYQSTAVVVSGNSSVGNSYRGFVLDTSSNNTLSDNNIQNSGGTTVNNAIVITGDANSNTVTGNTIIDSSATTNNYAINIASSTADTNYLANNTLGGGTVNDTGTGTIYANQYYNLTNFRIQPATNITMGSSTTTTTIQGSLAITPQTSTSTTLLCSGVSGVVSTCDSSVLAPTATNFIRNGTSQQASSNFNISGTGVASILQAATFDTNSAVTLNIGTANATGITLGKSGVVTTTVGGLLTNAIDTTSTTPLTIGSATASGISIGKSNGTTSINSSTIGVGTSGSATTIAGAAQTTSGNAGNDLTIKGSAGLGNGNGGTVNIQGGNAGTTGTSGGNLVLSGGTASSTGISGLVLINTAAYLTATVQSSATNVNVTQTNIDAFGTIILNATDTGVNFILSSPSLGTNGAGRVIYVTAANGSQDFTLRANVGGGTGVEQNIAMRQNTTATMIWNGSQWTAAGASSSTTLQAAYDNTLQSAGGAELVVSKTSATNGLTIRDSAINPVNGTLLSVQTSSAAGLLSVNSNVTEYATNAGAETAGSSQTSFPGNTWLALSGANITRYVTAGDYIATGKASVSAVTNTTAGSGLRNRLSTQLSPNMTYNVSFTTRLLSGTFTDLEVYYSANGTAASVPCTTGKAAATSVWTKVNCAFAAPASGITADNSIFIRQTSSGTARTFYVDNLSVTIAADFNYASDGSVTDGDNFTTNWLFGGLGAGSITRNLTDGQDASDSAQVTLTTGAANAGIRNKLSLNPLPNTLYRVTVYAKVGTGTFNDFKVRYSRDGSTAAGGNYVDCKDYNTRSLSTTAWTRITCFIQTDGTTATNPHVYFVEEASAARTFRVDAFTMTLTTNTAPNVQIGGGENGGPTTLLTLDKAASAPIAINNDALLGSMYYDTTLGKLQCYEADGWGACGSSPDTIVTISPEFTNAVLHGTGVGTMVSDLCSDTLNINDGSSGQPNICGTNETYNFYKWTSPQPSAQMYSVYVTYQLPASFKSFESGSTSIRGRTDSANSTIEYQVYRNDAATGLIACGPMVTVSSGAAGSWQPGVATGTSDPSTCGFAPGNSVVFRINVTASQNANAYIGNLNFIFSNR